MLERGKKDREQVEFVVIDELVPREHLLRKIDAAVDFERLYEMVEPLYSEDNGRPSIDPVVLFKMVLIQHLYGLPSLRRTADDVSANICYRWFLGYTLQEETPHFSTVSYNFRHRFTAETVDQVFAWILSEVADAGYLSPRAVFIDGTHIKANANTKKQVKEQIPAASKHYAKELMEEAGLSNDHPIFHPISDTAANKLRDEMLRLTQYPDNSRPLGIIGQLYLIMDALIQGSSNKKRLQGGKLSRFYAQEALSFIEQNYTLPITVEDMANRCNLDRSYFGKVFKDMIGQSPQDFLIRYRMSKATSLLTSTSLSIGDISVQVGYPNQLHFSRAFRNIYGMSPRQYRQQNKLLS